MGATFWFIWLPVISYVPFLDLVETFYQPCESIPEKYPDATGYEPAQFNCNCWCQIKNGQDGSRTYLLKVSADIERKAIMFDLVYFNGIDDNVTANIDPSIGKEIGFFASYLASSIEKLKIVNKLKGDYPIPKDAFYSWVHINDTMYSNAEDFTNILNSNRGKIRSIKLTHNYEEKKNSFFIEIPETTQLEQLFLDRNAMSIKLQTTMFVTDPAASHKFDERGVFIYASKITNSYSELNFWFGKDDEGTSVVYEPIYNGTDFNWPSFYSEPDKPVKSIAIGVCPETKEIRHVNITLPKEIFQYIPSIELLCLPLNTANSDSNYLVAVEVGALGIDQFISRQFSFAALGNIKECKEKNKVLQLTAEIHNFWKTGLCFEIVTHSNQNALGKYALCAYCLSLFYKEPKDETKRTLFYKYQLCYHKDPKNNNIGNASSSYPMFPMTTDDMASKDMWKPVEHRTDYVSLWAPVAGYAPKIRDELVKSSISSTTTSTTSSTRSSSTSSTSSSATSKTISSTRSSTSSSIFLSTTSITSSKTTSSSSSKTTFMSPSTSMSPDILETLPPSTDNSSFDNLTTPCSNEPGKNIGRLKTTLAKVQTSTLATEPPRKDLLLIAAKKKKQLSNFMNGKLSSEFTKLTRPGDYGYDDHQSNKGLKEASNFTYLILKFGLMFLLWL